MHKILVVDDQIENLKLVANILKAKDYQMALAQSASEGMDILKTFPADLILLDVMMPETDGYTMCRYLKEKKVTADIPVIFLTARREEEDIVQGFNAGGVDYVTKPFFSEELVSRINNHLRLKDAYNIIVDQRRELEEANRAKDQLFAVISHDMRTPIASTQLLLGQLINNMNDWDLPRVLTYLKHIQVSTNDTFQLLDNLLNWSRKQLNSLTFSPVLFDVSSMTRETVKLQRFVLEKKDVEVKIFFEDELIVYADEEMVKAVLRNLLQNAIKFSYKDALINIYASVEKDVVSIAVEDFGKGMNNEIHQKIMADNYYTSLGVNGEKGTGLGLSLVKRFCQLNKGTFRIDYEREQGIKACFTLPRHHNDNK